MASNPSPIVLSKGASLASADPFSHYARAARAWSEFQEETRKMQHFELLPAEKITSVRRARARGERAQRARERNLSSEASDFERTP